MSAPKTDFSEGADFISFGFSPSPPPQASPSNASSSTRLAHSSLPNKPGTSDSHSAPAPGSDRKGKRKASDIDTSHFTSGNQTPSAKDKDKDKKSKKQKKGKRDRDSEKRDKEKEKEREDADTGPRNLKEERRAAERHAPWAELVDWKQCRDPAEMLNEEINAFYKYVSPTKEEFEVRLFMIEMITRAIMKLWPDAEVTPFGSWQTQLYLPQGDIDLVVSNKHFSESNKSRLLAEMAKAMRMGRITDTVAIISRARVPIIKFITNEGKLNVDISLNQVNGISAGKIINQYLDALPGARQLILVVKSFLSQRSMNEVYTGGLGSYAVICLVISFLQVHPKLRRSELDPEDNLGTLLIEFFELYGRNFNYQDVGLSIRKGGYYYLKSSRGWQRPNQSFLLSIEDPQDRDNDISSGSFGIRQVKNTLAGAYELLLMRLFERADEMSGRSSGRNRIDFDPDRMSILTGVMGITKETLKQRTELRKLHSEGRLQRILGIPIGADPKEYVTNYREPPSLQSGNQSGKSARSGGRGNNKSTPLPGPEKERNTSNGVAAIIVDDDEVGSDVSDSDYFDSDADFDVNSLLNSDSDDSENAEDGEIVEIPSTRSRSRSDPQKGQSNGSSKSNVNSKAKNKEQEREALKRGAKAVEMRYGSEVSEDSIEILSSPPPTSRAKGTKGKQGKESELEEGEEEEEEEEEESRYALSSKSKEKAKAKAKAKSASEAVTRGQSSRKRRQAHELDSTTDSDSESESDSASESDISIQEVDPKTLRPKTNGKGNGKTDQGKGQGQGVKSKDRKAFWASKGFGGAAEDDEWDDGADFVGLD